MFDLSLGEIALVVVVAVVFIGPKELPVVVRGIAKALRSLKSLSSDVRKAFDEMTRESGLDDAKKDIEREVRLIQGDDGKFYESYTMPDISAEKPHDR